MSKPLPILPIKGVPDELLQALNSRFRGIGEGGAATGVITGPIIGAPGPAGPPGAGGVYNAPELVSITAAPAYVLWSHDTAFTFDGDIVVDDASLLWPNMGIISVIAYGPSAPHGAEIAHLISPFTVDGSHQVHFIGESGRFPQATADEVWVVVAIAWDKSGTACTTPVSTDPITVPALSLTAISGVEILPRTQDQNASVRTKLTATVTAAQVPQIISIWLERIAGGLKVLQGWHKIEASPADILLPPPANEPAGYYAPTEADEDWRLYAAPGALSDTEPPANEVHSDLIRIGMVVSPLATGVTAASATDPYTFTDVLGNPNWGIADIVWTDPDVSDPLAANYDINCFKTVLTFQCTDEFGNPAPGAGTGDMGGDEVAIAEYAVPGGKVRHMYDLNSFGFNPGTIYHYACLQIYSLNRQGTSFRDGPNSTKQTCWGGATPWRVIKDFHVFPGSSGAAFAPNLAAVSIQGQLNTVEAVPNYSTVGGLPKWDFNWTVTFPTTESKTTIRKIHLTMILQDTPGASQNIQTIGSAQYDTPDFLLSGLVMSGKTPVFDRDTITLPKPYLVQFWAENSDGILTASPPQALVKPTSATAPFGGVLPLPPQIPVLNVNAILPAYLAYGHLYKLGFSNIGWTVPANDNNVAYSVRIVKISPPALGSQQGTIDTVQGPFTQAPANTVNPPGTVLTPFTSSEVDAGPTVAANWTIRLIPYNADNVAAPWTDVTVAVAPNVIAPGSLIAFENPLGRYTQPGGAAFTQMGLTATMTSANAPGLAIGAGQVRTDYFSRDDGATWKWFGWFQQKPGSGTGNNGTFWDIDRPTIADPLGGVGSENGLTHCKVASAIGAWDAIPDGSPFSALPPNAVVSGLFTFARVGAPSATSILPSSFQVNPRTATGAARYHDVVITTAGTLITWGLPDGIQWVNPPRSGPGTDPNFFYGALTFQAYETGFPPTPGVPGTGHPAPPHSASPSTTTDQGGLEVIVHQWSEPGLINFTDVEGWTFNPPAPPGSPVYGLGVYRLYAVSRSANDWTDGTTKEENGASTPNGRTFIAQLLVDFGPAPPQPGAITGPLTLSFSGADTAVGIPYSASLIAAGGSMPWLFSISAGALPDGLILDTATGRISNTPTKAGDFSFTGRVTDSASATATVTCVVHIAAAGSQVGIVLTATGAVTRYQSFQNTMVPVFEGTVFFPTGALNYASLDAVWVWVVNPSGVRVQAIQIIQGWRPATSAPFSGWTYAVTQTDADQSGWSLHFQPINADGIEIGEPAVVTPLTIKGLGNPSIAVITSVAVAEVAGSRRQEEGGGNTYVDMRVTITFSQAQTTIPTYTMWHSFDGPGVIKKWLGWFQGAFGTTSVSPLHFFIPLGLNNTYRVYVAPGTHSGDTPPPTAVITTSNPIVNFTIGPAAATGAVMSVKNNDNLDPTVANIFMGANPLNNPYARVIVKCQTPGNGDPAAFYYDLWHQWTDAGGASVSPGGAGGNVAGWKHQDEFTNDGQIHSSSLDIDYPLGDYWITFQVWARTRNSVGGGPPFSGDAGATVIQWPGGNLFYRLHVGLAPGQPGAGAGTTGNTNIGLSILSDPSFEYSRAGQVGANNIITGPGWFASSSWLIDVTTPPAFATVMASGGHSGPQYLRLGGYNAQLKQTFAIQAGLPIYVQFWLRSNSPVLTGTHALGIAVYWISVALGIISVKVIGSVVGSVGAWALQSMIIPASDVPAGANLGLLSFQIGSSEPGDGYWEIDDVVVQQVIQQSNSGQMQSMGTAGAGPVAPATPTGPVQFSTTTTANSYFALNMWYLMASDQSYANARIDGDNWPLTSVWTNTGGGNGILIQATAGGNKIQIVHAGNSRDGRTFTLRDGFGVDHFVRNGIIVS